MAISASDPIEERGLRLSISPHGRLAVEGAGDDPGAAARLVAAFARGTGHGLLHLGGVEVATALPPSFAFFRDYGRLYFTGLRGVADLEEKRGDAKVPPPREELPALIASAPPMRGLEFLDEALLEALWVEMEEAFRVEVGAWDGSVADYLHAKNPVWNLVGRVCFHLAENREDETHPFAFLATYTTRLTQGAKPRHLPLGRAVADSARTGDRSLLLSLLAPVEKAAAKSAFLQRLVDSGELFHPLAWTPADAHAFLKDVVPYEEAGVMVRVPDFWKARRPPRVQLGVSIGGKAPSKLGRDALLDFSIGLSVDGEPITDEEWREIQATRGNLVLLRGQWVEVDRAKLAELLSHWKNVRKSVARDGISFLEGMRLLAGTAPGEAAAALPAETREWSSVVAGDWLRRTLETMRGPETAAAADPGDELKAVLRPYQRVGLGWMRFLDRLGFGACLADDMGLGKTIQVIALLLLRRKDAGSGPHLLVVPASLIGNWQSEIDRFAPSLKTLIAHPSAMPPAELAGMAEKRVAAADLVISTYGGVHRLPWVARTKWDLVILDEAQAIKNPAAKQTRAVKELASRNRIVLTGTPVENRLSDLWSLFDFLNPGLLGSAKTFAAFVKRLDEGGADRWRPLRELCRPYILRRLKTDKRVVSDLPDKTEVRAYCPLSRVQAALYQQAVEDLRETLARASGMKRRGAILAFLLRFKQICNHPSQWLRDGAWDPADSGKLGRLREIAETIAARQEKVLVFTQFREMAGPLSTFLATVFGRTGLVLHGETPVKERKGLVDRFQDDDAIPYFVLSVKAGGTGLNLTAASHVIHFDRWWNPAVENQATDRAYRIGQKKNVLVHKFVCRGTVEEKIDALIEAKRGLAGGILEGGGEVLLTEMSDDEILRLTSLDIERAVSES